MRFFADVARVVVPFFGFFICGCQSNDPPHLEKDTLERIQATKVLEVGYVVYPPAVVKDPLTGKLSGHFVDAVEELGHVMNVQIEFHEATWGTFAAGLQTGQFDLSIAPTFRTIPRALAVAFTRPLFYVGNSAIIRRGDDRIKELSDLRGAGLRIAVTQGEAGHEYATANLREAKLTVLSTADQSLAFTEVSTGRADVALGDAWAVTQYAQSHPEVVDLFANRPYNLTSVGWAVRPGETRFLQFLNTALDFFDDTGKLAQWEKQCNAPWYHRTSTWARY